MPANQVESIKLAVAATSDREVFELTRDGRVVATCSARSGRVETRWSDGETHEAMLAFCVRRHDARDGAEPSALVELDNIVFMMVDRFRNRAGPCPPA